MNVCVNTFFEPYSSKELAELYLMQKLLSHMLRYKSDKTLDLRSNYKEA